MGYSKCALLKQRQTKNAIGGAIIKLEIAGRRSFDEANCSATLGKVLETKITGKRAGRVRKYLWRFEPKGRQALEITVRNQWLTRPILKGS